MNEEKIYERMEQEIIALANKYSVTRLKISTLSFDREYRRGEAGQFLLVSTKAVIRALGKVTKVPIGDDQEFKTFEEAEAATKKYWSEYYKGIRSNRSAEQIKAEKRRQKQYRERRKQKQTALKRQQ